jgi:hypothetical protein
MHVGNLQAAAGRLHEALEALQLQWETTREQWQDDNARHIDVNLLTPLAREISVALPSIAMMSQAFAQAHREVSE